MNGETSFQASKPVLCANGGGYFGSTATNHLCSKCLKNLGKDLAADVVFNKLKSPALDKVDEAVAPPVDGGAEKKLTTSKRCGCCKKKVGLTGFACKCGVKFCGAHRYPEEHCCSFDYKGKGKEAIARANPIVKADKIQRF